MLRNFFIEGLKIVVKYLELSPANGSQSKLVKKFKKILMFLCFSLVNPRMIILHF